MREINIILCRYLNFKSCSTESRGCACLCKLSKYVYSIRRLSGARFRSAAAAARHRWCDGAAVMVMVLVMVMVRWCDGAGDGDGAGIGGDVDGAGDGH